MSLGFCLMCFVLCLFFSHMPSCALEDLVTKLSARLEVSWKNRRVLKPFATALMQLLKLDIKYEMKGMDIRCDFATHQRFMLQFLPTAVCPSASTHKATLALYLNLLKALMPNIQALFRGLRDSAEPDLVNKINVAKTYYAESVVAPLLDKLFGAMLAGLEGCMIFIPDIYEVTIASRQMIPVATLYREAMGYGVALQKQASYVKSFWRIV